MPRLLRTRAARRAWETIAKLKPRGVILSGGPASVYEHGAPTSRPGSSRAAARPRHLLRHALAGPPARRQGRSRGRTRVRPRDPQPGGRRVADSSTASRPRSPSGCPTATASRRLPPGFHSIAYSDNSPIRRDERRRPDLRHPVPPRGRSHAARQAIIENFLYKICGLRGDWTPGNFIADAINRIRKQVGAGRVICALSGGVDSAVAPRSCTRRSATSSPASSSTTA